jgi:hypothetical protein
MMSTNPAKRVLAAAVLAVSVAAAMAQSVDGTTGSGSGSGWQSSWLDLKSPATFKKGEKLAIKVDGTAENVLVRLLPASAEPSSPVGVEGKARKVPGDRVLMVVLERDHPNIKQISVHGGPSAWSTSLGGNNGAVSIVSIDRVTK